MPTLIKMPRLGESVMEGTIGSWLKQEGEIVEQDEPLAEIITDKTDTEFLSPFAGRLTKILVKTDETVSVGTDIALIEEIVTAPVASVPSKNMPDERKEEPLDLSELSAENFRLDIQDYIPTMATSRQKLVVEASEKGKSFAKADYPYAMASGQVLSRLAEKLAKDWYTNMAEVTKEYIQTGKMNKELYEYWLVKWADFNEEILRLYTSAFVSGYEKTILELQKKDEDK